MSATWRKKKSTVETNEVMKTAAHRSESWCWHQLHAADTCSKTRHVPFLCVKTQTSVLKEQEEISSSLDEVMSTREDVIRRRHVLLRCAESSLNHEWSKTASFVSCLDACLDAIGVRSPSDRSATVTGFDVFRVVYFFYAWWYTILLIYAYAVMCKLSGYDVRTGWRLQNSGQNIQYFNTCILMVFSLQNSRA
jgi:hypothetical protein